MDSYKRIDHEINHIKISQCSDVDKISKFLYEVNYSINKKEVISSWINEGHKCWVAKDKDTIVGILWGFYGTFEYLGLSGRTLSMNKQIKLNNAVYLTHQIVSPRYRGCRIATLLIINLIKDVQHEDNIKQVISKMRASNAVSFRVHNRDKLVTIIGIIFSWQFFSIQFRKEIFLDKKKVTWK
tara:strand:+ start:317 stop:865 length:549 start_codon:yes stop_codon:yes gene_type:complete